MSSGEFDPAVVQSRLLLMDEVLDHLASAGALARAGALEPALAEGLKPSVGLRNVLAHEYVAVDLGIVAAAAGTAQRDCRAYVRSVSAWLSDR